MSKMMLVAVEERSHAGGGPRTKKLIRRWDKTTGAAPTVRDILALFKIKIDDGRFSAAITNDAGMLRRPGDPVGEGTTIVVTYTAKPRQS